MSRLLPLLLLLSGLALPCSAQTAFINEFHTNDESGGFIDYEGDGTNEAFTDLEFVEFAIETESDTLYDASDVVALFYNGNGTYAGYAIGPSYWTKGERQGKYTLYSYGPFSIPLELDPENPPVGALPDGTGAIALTWWDEEDEALHLIDFVSYGDTVSVTDDRYIGSVTAPPIESDEDPVPASDTSALNLYSMGLTGTLEVTPSAATQDKARSANRPALTSPPPLRQPDALLDRIRQAPAPVSSPQTKAASTASPPDSLDWTVFANTATPGRVNDNQSLPVELVQFDAVATESNVRLSWTTASEEQNAGFFIEHAHNAQPYAEIAFVESPGPSDTLRTYSHSVQDLPAGRHRFRLRQVDIDGRITYTRPVTVSVAHAAPLHVSAPTPTPFRNRTTITVSSTERGPLTVSAFDILGRQVARIWDGTVEAEEIYEFDLSAQRQNLAPGVYFIRVQTLSQSITRKTTLVR